MKYRKHGAGATARLKARDLTKTEAECLRRVGKKLTLTLAQLSLLNREIAALEAELAMVDAYEDLSSQAFDEAAEKLAQANAYYCDKRIVLAAYVGRPDIYCPVGGKPREQVGEIAKLIRLESDWCPVPPIFMRF